MKRFYIAIAWGSVAFLSLAFDITLWLIHHAELKNIIINSVVGVFCVISWVMYIRNTKKDIKGE